MKTNLAISKYEAVSLYEYVKRNLQGQHAALVIDLDDCSYGYCLCNDKSEIQTVSQRQNDKNLPGRLLDLISQHFTQAAGEVEQNLESQLTTVNEALRNYYLSDGMLDSEALAIGDQAMSCSQLDLALAPIKEEIEELIEQVKSSVAEDVLNDISIIVLGKIQRLYVIEVALREQLSYDPLLEDPRFKNDQYEPDTDMVAEGYALYEAAQTKPVHIYSILAYNPDKHDFEAVYTAQSDQLEQLENVRYSEPVLMGAQDKLPLRIDRKQIDVKLPYSFAPAPFDLIDAAIGMQNEEPTLFIRRCRFPTQIYSFRLMHD